MLLGGSFLALCFSACWLCSRLRSCEGKKTDQMLPGTRACAHCFWFATKYGVRKVGHLTGIFFVVHLTGSVLFVYVTLLYRFIPFFSSSECRPALPEAWAPANAGAHAEPLYIDMGLPFIRQKFSPRNVIHHRAAVSHTRRSA